ncbi:MULTISPECIES: NAD-dependent epimerase/dehydratase family protein [Sphingobacterium]|jgi:UDP-glucose 4-epimerase|uniref:NAD-dependent epimerase/dehydratase family protein n=1 Tax=Sphingobacterium TaxID=28453 RepID=UPI00257B6089|nr:MULTISPECIES: NAD-dependent epimerase/dehydratase family protein [Sphingobacterium]MDF2849805.1 NAD-dependent epimerase/dehydratase [Sphingobacterium multivorum]
MKKILVIGGDGFIGKNVVHYFSNNDLELPPKIVVLSRKLNEKETETTQVEFCYGDFSDINILTNLFSKYQFDAVFHFANTTVPSAAQDTNVQDIYENVVPSIQLMDVMKQYHCNMLLYLSSGGAVYGNSKEILNEEHVCHPISSYGIAKLTVENYIQLYHRLFGLDYLILRLSNPFGKYHTSSKQGIVNIAIRNALKGIPISIWGNGDQTKDYIFVEDIVKVIWDLLNLGIKNEIFNIGAGQSVSLNEILKKISTIIPNVKICYQESKVTDVGFFHLDITKLKSFIGFEPLDLDSGIIKTIEWEHRQMK